MTQSQNKKQNRIILLCFLVYMLSYTGRYSYNSNVTNVMADFGVSHASAGLVSTFCFFSYGIGQVLNGILCKFYNKKILFPIVLTVSALTNIAVYLIPVSGFPFIKFLWLLNGAAQSALWSSLIMIYSENLDKEHLKKGVVAAGAVTPAGTLLTYGMSALFSKIGHYRLSFLFGAVSMLAIAVVWLLLFQPSGIEIEKNKEAEKFENTALNARRKKLPISFTIMLVLFCCFSFECNFVRDTLLVWVPAIMQEVFGLGDSLSILLTLTMPILGFFGCLTALKLCKLLGDFIKASTLFFLIGSVSTLLTLLLIGKAAVPVLLFFGIISFMMSAVNNVVTSIAPVNLNDFIRSGLLAGILDGFCYLGSTVSSYGVGAIVDKTGSWNPVFVLLFATLCVCTLAGAVYGIAGKAAGKKKAEQ